MVHNAQDFAQILYFVGGVRIVIRCLKKEIVINFLILNDIFDCDFIGTLMSLSNKTFLFS
jgi:hypothetical protein